MRMFFSFCKVLVLLLVVSIFQWQALSAQKIAEEFEVQEGAWWTMNSNKKVGFSFVARQGSSLYLMSREISYAPVSVGWKPPALQIKYSLVEYDSLLNKVREKPLFKTNNLYKERLFACREYGGAFWCFYRKHTATSFSVYARRLDLKTMKSSEEKELISEEGKWKDADNYGLYPLEYDFSTNEGNDLSLFFIRGAETGDGAGHAYFTFQVFDRNLHSIWSKEVNLSVAPDLSFIEDVALRSDGTVYVLVKTRTSKKVPWYKGFYQKQKGVFWELMICSPDGKVLHTPIDANEKRILYDMQIALNERDGELICLGSYRDFADKQTPAFSGVFVGSYGLEQDSFLVKKHQRISPEAAAALIWGDRQGIIKAYENGENYGQVDVSLFQGFLREDGGFILQYITMVPEVNRNGQKTFTTGGVVKIPVGGAYMGLSPSGEIEWVHKLDKKVPLGEGEMKVPFFESKVFAGDNKLYFFFETKMLDGKTLKVSKLPARLGFYYLDDRGGLSDVYTLNYPSASSLDQYFPDVSVGISIGDDSLLFLTRSKKHAKTYRWIKVHYLELAKYQRL